MTRGRRSNNAYVALDQPDETHTRPTSGEDVTARTVLFGILQRSSGELSAHQTIAAQRPRWEALLRSSGLDETQTEAVITGDSFGPLTAALRRAEACGRNVDRLIPNLVDRRDLSDAEDIGAVLQHRLCLSVHIGDGKQVATKTRRTFIAGMIPEAAGPTAPEMREALDQRRELIENRTAELAEAAMLAGPAWRRRLGEPPATLVARQDWLSSVATVAAYRDRFGVTSDAPLGPGARTDAERADRRRALAAQRKALVVARTAGVAVQSAPVASHLRR